MNIQPKYKVIPSFYCCIKKKRKENIRVTEAPKWKRMGPIHKGYSVATIFKQYVC